MAGPWRAANGGIVTPTWHGRDAKNAKRTGGVHRNAGPVRAGLTRRVRFSYPKRTNCFEEKVLLFLRKRFTRQFHSSYCTPPVSLVSRPHPNPNPPPLPHAPVRSLPPASGVVFEPVRVRRVFCSFFFYGVAETFQLGQFRRHSLRVPLQKRVSLESARCAVWANSALVMCAIRETARPWDWERSGSAWYLLTALHTPRQTVRRDLGNARGRTSTPISSPIFFFVAPVESRIVSNASVNLRLRCCHCSTAKMKASSVFRSVSGDTASPVPIRNGASFVSSAPGILTPKVSVSRTRVYEGLERV